MDLSEIRQNIDTIDDEIKTLFEKRMNLAAEVAEYKRQNNLPVLNTKRERDIIARITEGQSDTIAGYSKILYTTLFDLSRSFQNRKLNADSELIKTIKNALEHTPNLFPASAVVACQGTEGAYSQLACDKLFARPSILYFGSWQGVFSAVEKGMCKYGMLPIENSLYGSVTGVYDLMKKYKFHIAKSIKLHINHVLLAKQGVKLSEIKEIYSHEQALGQCSEFLKDLPNVKITVCENTAVAAKTVADSDRRDIAAISSKNCAELYGLTILSDSVQNNDSNYTRFIVITKDLEIYPGSTKISLMFTIPHRPGSLYGLISKFSALGVNLTKLESRPIPGKDFEFMFYFDMEASVYSEDVLSLLAELESSPEQFMFLGSYSEI